MLEPTKLSDLMESVDKLTNGDDLPGAKVAYGNTLRKAGKNLEADFQMRGMREEEEQMKRFSGVIGNTAIYSRYFGRAEYMLKDKDKGKTENPSAYLMKKNLRLY